MNTQTHKHTMVILRKDHQLNDWSVYVQAHNSQGEIEIATVDGIELRSEALEILDEVLE